MIVNGGFLQAKADKVRDPLFARCLVLDDGKTRLAIAIVDSCMMPRELVDQAKALANQKTGIPVDRMLIAATHTHTAPSAMGALGTPVDPTPMRRFCRRRSPRGSSEPPPRLEPAKIGWAAIDDEAHTYCRRWIRRADRMIDDPFGVRSVRAHMHPGHVNPDVVGPSGAVDPGLTILAIQSTSGRPIAVLANYSMHYFGTTPVSADYYGRFAKALGRQDRSEAEAGDRPFVAMMSQGTSGDQQWMDYAKPRNDPGIDAFADQVADSAFRAYQSITTFDDHPPIAMAETELTLRRRTPDEQRLNWAKAIVDTMGDRVPKEHPRGLRQGSELSPRRARADAQASGDPHRRARRHGDPQRGLRHHRPEDQGPQPARHDDEHRAGQWVRRLHPAPRAARTSAATPPGPPAPPVSKSRPNPGSSTPCSGCWNRSPARRDARETPVGSRYAQVVLGSRPSAFWRLDEMDGAEALDASGHEHKARRSDGVALYLPGPELPGFRVGSRTNRANHLAGGTIAGKLDVPAEVYAVEFWFWNGVPKDAVLLERSRDKAPGDALGLTSDGRLVFTQGPGKLVGKTEIAPRTWRHVALVRQGREDRRLPRRQARDPGRRRFRFFGRRLDVHPRRPPRPGRRLRGQARRGRHLRPGD